MHIAIITAGGAGMFCGSCMHDNTWARALLDAGAEVSLIPTYTPIRLDEKDESNAPIFFGGINVYLDYTLPGWSRLPRWATRWLDAPWIIRLATSLGVSNDASRLGGLTLAMLRGADGPQRREVGELVDYIAGLRPDVVVFSNALLSGALPALRRRFTGKLLCIFQGDDVFLDSLPEPHRTRVIGRMQELATLFDGYLFHTAYYRDFMSGLLKLPIEKGSLIPLGIDLAGHDGLPRPRNSGEFTVGYFARICPEKGLHNLVAAFRLLHARHPQSRLRVGGYLGPRDEEYFRRLKAEAQDLGRAFEHVGSPATHDGKVAFLKSLDVLSVPTDYREPKGLYVLEALANGVPVVQPRHGSFPEMLEAAGGGLLVEPDSAAALAGALEDLLIDDSRRLELARQGHAGVRAHFDGSTLAHRSLAVFHSLQSEPAP